MMGEAAERGYVVCKCGTVYARLVSDDCEDDACMYSNCRMSVSEMRPIDDDEASRRVPAGSTIVVLRMAKATH